jgi:hypothetical protein
MFILSLAFRSQDREHFNYETSVNDPSHAEIELSNIISETRNTAKQLSYEMELRRHYRLLHFQKTVFLLAEMTPPIAFPEHFSECSFL